MVSKGRSGIIMKNLAIIKAGTTYFSTLQAFGDFEDWVRESLEPSVLPVTVVDAVSGNVLPDPDACCGVIVTGSHAMVTDNHPWSVAIEAWIPMLVKRNVPFLGICYGHQLLGRSLGGVVGYNPRGREIGTVAVSLTSEACADPLFREISGSFPAHTIHEQSVLELPSGSVRLACNGHDSHHAFRVGRCAWGVQFHPEYTTRVMRAYIEAAEGLDKGGEPGTAVLLSRVRETPEANRLLKDFAAYCSFHG